MKEYSTFICYRRGDSNRDDRKKHFYKSELIAGLINKWICSGDDIRFNDEKNSVLFEEECREEGRNFNENAIKDIMSSVRKFIVVICPGFFTDLLEKLGATIDILAGSLKAAGSYAGERDRTGFQLESLSIAFIEIIYAMLNKNCSIYPVWVNAEGTSAYPGPEDTEKIKKIFTFLVRYTMQNSGVPAEKCISETEIDNKVSNLIQQQGRPEIPFDGISELFEGKRSWGELNGREPIFKPGTAKKGETVSRMRKIVLDSFFPVYKLNDDDLKADLKRIRNTLENNKGSFTSDKIEVDPIAYRRCSLDEDKAYYCITNAYMFGVESKKTPENKAGKYLGFYDIKKNCGVFPGEKNENDFKFNFNYYNLDLNDGNSGIVNPTVVNICAACFGAMLVNNWMKQDHKYASDGYKKDRDEKTVYGSLNLMIALRDYIYLSWMSEWNLIKPEMNIDGTLNQTTLTLSALITCGFLDIGNGCSGKNLLNRFEYVEKSIEWLRNAATVNESEALYWKNEGRASYNLSLTIFCFDVFVKYAERLKAAIAANAGKALKNNLKKIENDIWRVLNEVLHKTLLKSLTEKPEGLNIVVLSKLLKALCGYFSYRSNGLDEDNIYMEAVNVASEILKLLIGIDPDVIKNLGSDANNFMEEFSRNADSESKNEEPDKYENCAELIYTDALAKAGRYDFIYNKVNIEKSEIIDRVRETLGWYRGERVRNRGYDEIDVLGRTDRLKFPIYAYYYYRMVIYDYFRLTDVNEETK